MAEKFNINNIEDEIEDKNSPSFFHNFYEVKWKNNRYDGIKINLVKLVSKFKEMGIYRYDTSLDDFVLCQITNNLISKISQKQIVDMFEEYIKNIPPIDHMVGDEEKQSKVTVTADTILPNIYNQLDRLFNKKILERLRPDTEIVLQEDTLTSKYVYFKNAYTVITADKITSCNYSTLSKKIWKSNILNHEFEHTEEEGNFEKFIFNVSSKNNERKQSLMSMLGYLQHDYHQYKKHLILLTDMNSDGGEPNGRTGKTLIGKALSYTLNQNPIDTVYTEIDGKTFNPKDTKKYMTADIDTKLIHVNDIFAWFKIEDVFTDITDGLKVHHHYEKPFIIMAKMMMTANMTVRLSGSSAWDRVKVFEVSNHYSDKYNPEMEFGQWFFRDWDNKEWNKFYSFMARCCQVFLKHGIIEPEMVNYNKRMLIEHTAPEFVSWFEEYFTEFLKNNQDEMHHLELRKRSIYDSFTTEYPDFLKNRRFTQRRISQWCGRFMKFYDVDFKEIRSTEDIFLIKNHKNISKALFENQNTD